MEPGKKNEMGTILGGLAFVAFLAVTFTVIGRWKPAREAVAATPATASSFRLGEIVAVKDPELLVVSVSPAAGAAEQRYAAARDASGMRELQDARLVSYQDGGGNVRVTGFDADPEATRALGCDATWIQIRRIDGEYEGSGGWVDARSLKRR